MKTRFQIIDPRRVASVYSGKPNRCCCGCSGTYHYPERNRDQAGPECKVSDRGVARLISTVEKLISEGGHRVQIWPGGVSVQTDSRLRAVYFEEN